MPTPVGPQNSMTAGGRFGSFSPAFTVITTFVAASHASGWSITRSRNQFNTSSRFSVISSRRNNSGSPVRRRKRSTTAAGVTGLRPSRAWASTISRANPDAGPGNAAYGMNRRNSRTTRSPVPRSISIPGPDAAVSSCLSITTSAFARSNAATGTIWNRSGNPGISRRQASSSAGVASATIRTSPRAR